MTDSDWLVAVASPHHSRRRAARTEAPAPSGAETTVGQSAAWLRKYMVIERDVETDQIVIEESASGRWIHAYPDRNLLITCVRGDPEEVDVVEWTGVQLRDWVRRNEPTVGVVYHPTSIDEQIVLRPEAQPVQRMTVE